MTLKVLQVYRTYFPDSQGGAQEAIRQICLSTLGVAEHRIFTPSPSPEPAVICRDEGEVHRAKLDFEIASCGFTFSGIKRFRALYEWADVIHCHYPWPFADVLELLSQGDKPLLVTYHSDIVRQRIFGALYRPLRDRFLGRADCLVCTSPDYQHSSDVLARYAAKTRVIPLGLDETSYPPVSAARVDALAQEYGRDFFLFVGVLRYYKGLEVLLRAAGGLPANVVIAGAGPLDAELRQRQQDWGLGNVFFAGHVPDEDKMALFALARGVVFPSIYRSEAFGVTLLEGAMAGRPLIGTDVGSGTTFVNVDGETGLVVPPGDASALREAMMRLAADPELAEQMGQAARRRFETLFTGEVIGKQYGALYRELAGQD